MGAGTPQGGQSHLGSPPPFQGLFLPPIPPEVNGCGVGYPGGPPTLQVAELRLLFTLPTPPTGGLYPFLG